VLDAQNRTPEAIRDAVHLMLTDRTYRENAERVRDTMMALPGPQLAVTLLEQLAVQRNPSEGTTN
jgi:UDP:flavonoid glycosyltransferase YjiC (YdhE family)